MGDIDKLELIRIADHAERLIEPFTMIDLAQIDDLGLSLYLCQGSMPFHRHLDQDELFLVHTGTISLDSDWGTVILRPGELAVVPKGVSHRSASLLRSLVLLLQPRLVIDRRNGDRRLFTVDEGRRLEKVSLPALGRQVLVPFSPVLVAHVDTFALNLTLCEGVGPWHRADRQASLVLCCEGRLSVDTETSRVSVGPAELVVVPSGVAHRLSTAGRAIVVGLERHEPPGLGT